MLLPNKNDALHKAWLYRTLSAIADDTFLTSVLCFKGGTCAAMRGFLDRFSVDLDFDYIGDVQEMDKARNKLELIFKKLDLKILNNSTKPLQYFLKYESKLGRANLKIDTFFPPLKGNKYEFVRFNDINRIIQSQTIETMFANKMIALIDRYKSKKTIAGRDLYDIHHFFLKSYPYSHEIIENYAQKSTKDFLSELHTFIEKKVTQKIIDQDINTLLPMADFQKIRKVLKQECLMFIEAERHA